MIEIEYIEIIDSGDDTVGITEGRYSINGPLIFTDQQCLTDFKKEILELFESHGHISGRGMVVDNRDIGSMQGGLDETSTT